MSLHELTEKSRSARDKARRLREEMSQLHERAGSDTLTPGEQERWGNLEAGVKAATAEADALDEQRMAEMERGLANGTLLTISGDSTPTPGFADDTRAVGGVRGEALRAVDADRNSSDATREAITVAIERDRSGEVASWAKVAASPHYLRAYTSLLVDPERAHLGWSPAEREAFSAAQTEARAMSIGTPGSGGYLVPTSLDPAWILTNDGTENPIRDLARKVIATTSSWTGVATGGVTAEWKTEGAEVADAGPTDLTAPNIPVHLADVFVPFSFELEQDSMSLANELSVAMADAKTRHEAVAFTTGTGSGQPTGLIKAVSADSGSIVAPTTAETFAVTDVYKVAGALPARHQTGATWLANPTTELLIRQFATGSGPSHAFWADLGAGSPPTLVGKPWRVASEMDGTFDPSATVAHNYLLAYGDFSKYVVADRVGTVTELVPHVFGSNGRPTGQRGILMHWRVGADCTDTNAFRLLDIPTTA